MPGVDGIENDFHSGCQIEVHFEAVRIAFGWNAEDDQRSQQSIILALDLDEVVGNDNVDVVLFEKGN
jgi:hypothetical protein